MSAKRKKVIDVVPEPAVPLRLDLGCGKNKQAGFIGVDQYNITGVDIVADLTQRWPWNDREVAEVHCSHFLEHLTNFNGKWQRVRFFNELYRVMKHGAKCQLIIPHWASNRYYGDPTHCEPFSEMGFFYLNRAWRREQTPATDIAYNPNGYSCDFDFTCGYSLHQNIINRNQEYQQYALANYKEAAQDLIATLTKPDAERP